MLARVNPWDAVRAQLEAELGEPITIDALTGAWQLAQRARGHRHSSDDVLTAWYALAVRPPGTRRALDLGCGIGGVGLLVLWGLGDGATLACVEAQAVSYRLLRANVEGNGLAARVDARLGDLRELALAERFALVTGSPPYFPPGTGVMPADAQKAHARFELRGDIGDYARAAARDLAAGGVFACCFPTAQHARAVAALAGAGLALVSSREVIPGAGRRPLFSLYAARRAGEGESAPGPARVEPPLVVRDAAGALTAEMQEVRRGFGHAP